MYTLLFNSYTPKYNFLSNFYPCNVYVVLKGIRYQFPTAEHLYQATKQATFNAETLKPFQTGTAAAAKTLGNDVVVRDDWDNVKKNVMQWILEKKFSPQLNYKLADDLKNTHPARLVHLSPWDLYWGAKEYENGRIFGQNNLGILIEGIREKLLLEEERKK